MYSPDMKGLLAGCHLRLPYRYHSHKGATVLGPLQSLQVCVQVYQALFSISNQSLFTEQCSISVNLQHFPSLRFKSKLFFLLKKTYFLKIAGIKRLLGLQSGKLQKWT